MKKNEPRTIKEIEALKANWVKDPCWDIEDTEGFELHREELRAFNQQKQKEWSEAYIKNRQLSIKNSLVHPLRPDTDYMEYHGLTKREYFAAMALQGFLTNPDYNDANHEQTAKMAVKAADALLNELNKE